MYQDVEMRIVRRRCQHEGEEGEEEEEEECRKYVVNIFLPSQTFSKLMYLTAWRELSHEHEFHVDLGPLFSSSEVAVIKQLERANLTGTAVRSLGSDKVVLYFAGRTRESICLLEVQIQKYEDDLAAGAVNYRADCRQPLREVEDFLVRVLSAAKDSRPLSGSSSPSSGRGSSCGGGDVEFMPQRGGEEGNMGFSDRVEEVECADSEGAGRNHVFLERQSSTPAEAMDED